VSDEEKTEQTAVAEEANVDPKEGAAAESGAAQKDGLDELLKEFDSRVDEPKEVVETKSGSKDAATELAALEALERRLNEQEAREQRRELEAVCSRLSEGTQGDALDAEAYLIAQAKRNPKLEQAYLKRATNPKAWDDVYGALQKDFAKRYGKKVDKQATDSKEAVASAIRSASTAAPQKDYSDKEISTMSTEEFNTLQRKMGVSPL
jgi:hypothetical protein